MAFRCAAASENEDEGIARYYADRLIGELMQACGGDSYSVFISGQTNFRYQVYPEYKANRLNQTPPRHRAHLLDHLHNTHAAVVSVDCEADDLMGIAQCADDDETVICSLDKDLLMIPGNHYSWEIGGTSSKGKKWVKEAEWKQVSDDEALRWFYTQVLIGDVADNIKGATGIGKVKAAAILRDCTGDSEYLEAIRPYFSCDEEIEMTGKVLWIFRKESDIWQIPENNTQT